MTIDLRTCVKGQKLLLRNKQVVTYIESGWSSDYPHATKTEDAAVFCYKCNGNYHADGELSTLDVVEILPLEIAEQPKTDKHPSVAWWESCPWITDRRPTEKDGNRFGQVMLQAPGEGRADTTCFMHWKYVKEGQTWIHSLNGSPFNQTPKEKALALIASHVCPWTPTLDDWILISEGLME